MPAADAHGKTACDALVNAQRVTEHNNKSSSDKGKGSSQSKQKNKNNLSSSSSNKGKSSEPKKRLTPDLSLKLRNNGKLTPQERQHCLNKNLCLFCGAPDHRAADCNKATAAAKACASKTTPATMESTSKHCCSEAK